MLCGVSRQNITPQVGGRLYGYRPDLFSVGKRDDLHLTAIALEKDGQRVLFLNATVCEIITPICDSIRQAIAEKTGWPMECILLCATHTHSGPALKGSGGWGDVDEEYLHTVFFPKTVQAARDAVASMVPATLQVGRGESRVCVNRREITMKDVVKLGQNPWGPFDPRMTLLRLFHGDVPLANLIFYGGHGTSNGTDPYITRDWMGGMCDAMEQAHGGLTAFFNTTVGDTGPRLRNGGTTGHVEDVAVQGEQAAKDILAIAQSCVPVPDTLQVHTGTLRIPKKPRIPYEEAAAGVRADAASLTNISRVKADYYARVKESYDLGEADLPEKVLPQTAVQLGGLLLATSPYELFSEIGLRIDRAFPDRTTHVLSLTNGVENYFPTQDALCRGGYEVDYFLHQDVQPYPPNADWHFIRSTIDNIKQLV